MDSISFKVVDFGIQLAVILFAISFHESAHAYSAFKLGDPTAKDLGRISLNPIRHLDPFGSVLLPLMVYILSAGQMIFGAAKPTPVDLRNTKNPRFANLVVSAAGPLSNFFLATLSLAVLLVIKKVAPEAIVQLAYALGKAGFARGALAPIVYVLFYFTMVNVALGVFNLIPIPPLDGSGVAISLLGESAARAYASIARYGFLILMALIYFGALGWIFRPILTFLQAVIFGGL